MEEKLEQLKPENESLTSVYEAAKEYIGTYMPAYPSANRLQYLKLNEAIYAHDYPGEENPWTPYIDKELELQNIVGT